MPMKENEPFKRKEIRADLKDDEEVFYCSVTDEIFESYEEFCEQVLLVNSLIWSCSYTGKSGLTFEEAVASEEHVRSVMKDFPIELRIPVLYLGSITQRTSLENMAEDVFSFSKDRFFVGESVEVNFIGNSWCECHVIQVIEPTQEEINANATESKREQSRLRFEAVASSLFRYEVESLDEDSAWGGEQVVAAAQVRRKKGCYTRDKNRMYLQQFSEPGPNGVWKVKNDILVKHGVQRVKFENIFIGKAPVFQASTNVRKPSGKASKQGTIDRYLTASNTQNKKKAGGAPAKRTPQKETAQKVKEKYRHPGGVTKKYRKKEQMVMSVEMLQKLREQQKEEALEKRRKMIEEKVKQRAQLKEEKRRLAEFMKKWNQQREDLECEDLKPLPVPTAVQCRVPNEHFGHFLMILEFFHNFAEPLATKDSFPYGMTFDLVERALSEKEVAGPLSDMLQFLLSSLFFMQGEEDDEILDSKTVPDIDIDDTVDVTTSEAIQQATAAAGWSQQYQGTALSKLPLDSVTVTEVLRLHLLSSGGEVNVKWRYQQRGGYTSRDDPGLQLRMQQPHILRALSVNTVFELPLADKLSIMTCLMDQILTYAALRDVVEESLEKYRVQKIELKVHQLSMMKREKELSTLRVKQRKEQRRAKGEPAVGAPGAEGAAPPEEPELTEAELEERIGRLEKEMTKGLGDVQRRTAEVNAVATGHRAVPLGMDRAHRRFWVFNSCPGLFVENDPNFVGPCLAKPTPTNAATDCNDTLSYVRRLFEEEKCNGGSDKENDVDGPPDKKRPAAAASPKKSRSESLRADAEDVKAAAGGALVCSASEACAVHGGSAHRTKWSFFSKEDDVDGLLASLNCRGVRESDLRHNLAEESRTIVKALAKCPVQKLDQTRVDEAAPEERKNSRSTYAARYVDSNLNFPPNTEAAEIFELTLRDLIVDLEEKIQHGGLGSLKVYDRTEWRTAIIERKYDKQCDKLEWGGQAKTESSEPVANAATARLNGRSSRGSRPATPAADPADGKHVKSEPAEVKLEPVEYKDPGKLLGQHDPAQNPVVRHLASAILQLGQSLEKKYRQKPLVPDEEDWGQVERWEMSLMASTGLSQLFVHYYTLESSIQWSRSALNANCRLCRRRGDAENMLLCDSCNKGHHLYCLKPKLTKVPQGDWFCPKCRPEVKTPRVARKRRAIFVPDEEEADEDNELIEPAEGEPMFVEVCDTCGEGGHVICCDTTACGLVFHIECLQPPLKKVPRGKWYCPKCKAPDSTAAAERHPRAAKDSEWQPKQQSPPVARSRRGCAAAAVAKISKFTKRIQSRASWEDDEEEEEEASSTSALSDETQPSRRSARKSLEPDPDLPLNNAVLQDLLTDVMKHRDAWPFLRPVPKAQVPDYHIIIKRPMDLGTMKNKLNMLNYTNNSEFIADANLVFENCKMYNHYDAVEYKAGVRLRKFFEKRCNEMGIHLSLEELQVLENGEHVSESKRMDNGVAEDNDTNGEEEAEEEEEEDEGNDDGEENTEPEDEEEEQEEQEDVEEDDDEDERGEEKVDTVENSEEEGSESGEDEPLKKIPRISDD